ncbi:MAG: hypothetical protein AAF682_21170 [Planctomycetota bacterium]
MRTYVLSMWLLLPIGAGAYHLGPGQDRLLLDDAGKLLARADEHAARAAELAASEGDEQAKSEWTLAEEAYEEALGLLPHDQVATLRRVRLERSKCRMFLSELPEANADLVTLVDEMTADPAADAEVLDGARDALANSNYYMTWLMRLEGAGRDEWEPRIEASRQTYKLLAEQAAEAGDEDAVREHREDLESAIRLARMDLTELQGLPLPSQ